MTVSRFLSVAMLRRKPAVLSLGLALLTLPALATAADFTPDPMRILSDPAYLPYRGQIQGITGFAHERATADVFNYAGILNHSYTTSADSLAQTFAYGVTDDFTLRLAEGYAWRSASNSSTGLSASADGFSNPTLGATWRVLDQRTRAFNWDIAGSFAPNVFNAKGASPTQDGTVARGGTATTLGTAISYETELLTFYAAGHASYLGARDILNANGTTTSYDSNWQYSVNFDTQTRLNRAFSINAGIVRQFNRGASGTNDTSLLTFQNNPGDVTSFTAALNYHITPDTLVASLDYRYDSYGNSSSSYPTQPTFDTSTRNHDANVLGLTLQYVFQ